MLDLDMLDLDIDLSKDNPLPTSLVCTTWEGSRVVVVCM
jgi:hypothetical protein